MIQTITHSELAITDCWRFLKPELKCQKNQVYSIEVFSAVHNVEFC